MRALWDLYISFFKIGAFTFGGGYAMLPMLQREVVQRHGWATEEELLDYYALSQCTPGVIAVNTATFVGTKLKGAFGGAISTLAVVTPSLLIILLISILLQSFAHYTVVQHALAGIRVAVAALVVSSVLNLWKKGVKGALGIGVFSASLLSVALFGLSPIVIVAGALVLGMLMARKESKKK